MEIRRAWNPQGSVLDVIVLSRNLCEGLATEVGKTMVLLTVVNGKTVWREGI